MANEDDLGDFFNEINQIEELPTVTEIKPIAVDERTLPSISHSTTKSVAAVVNIGDSKSSSTVFVSTKEAGHQNQKNSELVSANHAVYTYSVPSAENAATATDGHFTAGSAASHTDGFGSSSSSMRNTSIGPSIGPSGPPGGPRPPSSAATHSFPHSSSGGLNLSLHSFSTSYVTSTGTSGDGLITTIEFTVYIDHCVK